MPIRVEPHAEPIPGYKLIERIGGGGFGEVWKAEAPGGLLKAIKIVHGDMETAGGESQKADQELKALRRVITVRHPYILSLERFDIVDGRLLIVMELADRNLADRAKECRNQGSPGIPREELLRYLEETAEALDLMNMEFQLQHLDIKPQNLFLVHNHIKVADFGLVKDLQDRMAATITGGVTPVYAAPETFDGWVSRFCDQYSLAIVYQELLTGQRPFAATNVHQLVMQHVQGKPKLDSLASGDREVVARALAKNPDERFPSCMDMARALRDPVSVSVPVASGQYGRGEKSKSSPHASAESGNSITVGPIQRAKPASRQNIDIGREGTPRSAPTYGRTGPAMEAAISTDGDLVPALVIGLGHLGLVAANEFARQVRERFGSTEALPQTRLLAIDTDAFSLPIGTEGGGKCADVVLHRRDVLIAKLNRAGYYLNPRNGRTRIDSWFDVNMLFRIRREPVTGGMRALGRLAFFGYYRSITARLDADLAAIMDTASWAEATRRTGLRVRSHEPRVYIVTSLAGGSGSGMFIDLAYLLQHRLRSMGHANPAIVGLFMLPQVASDPTGSLPLGNTYAALTELNHFSTLQQTGHLAFSARYDEREATMSSTSPPFARCVFVPAAHAEKDPETPARVIGEYLAHELTTSMGRLGDSSRPTPSETHPVHRSFGWFRYTWPRRQLLNGAAQHLCRTLVARWLAKTGGKEVQDRIEAVVQEQWRELNLGAEHLIGRFQQSCAKSLDKDVETALREITEPIISRGRHLKETDREAVQEALDGIDRILGQPGDSSVLHRPGMVEETLRLQTALLTPEWQEHLERFTVELLDRPEFRVVGAEEAARRTGRLIEQILTHHEPLCQELTRKALSGSERLRFLVTNYLGIFKGRRPELLVGELAELFASYPKSRFQSLILRRVIYTFTGLRGFLSDQIREIGFFRLRLGELAAAFQAPVVADQVDIVPRGKVLYPAGCDSLTRAVEQLAPPPTAEELTELDDRVQSIIEQQFGSLRHVCATASVPLRNLEAAMLAQATTFVSGKIPADTVVGVYSARHPDEEAARAGVRHALEAAAPTVRDRGSNGEELALVCVPAGEEVWIRGLAAQFEANAQVVGLSTTDDMVFYRECSCGLSAVIHHLGPAAEDAYRQLLDMDNFTPHSRTDVIEWSDPRSAADHFADARTY